MPKLKTSLPKLHKHHRGQAFVKLDGRQIWLGRYGDPETQQKYDRLIGEWLSNDRRLPEYVITQDQPEEEETATTLAELIADYWRWVEGRYKGRSERDTIKSALRVVNRLYGLTDVSKFGPKAFRIVRDEMVRMSWGRAHINKQISRVRSLFRWAMAEERVPYGAYHRLKMLEPLRIGEAKESPKVRPVPRAHIRVVRRRLSRQVRAIIALQLLSSARARDRQDSRRGLRHERARLEISARITQDQTPRK